MNQLNLNAATLCALLTWPAVALWLYKTRPPGQATIWTILGGNLLLPVHASFKIPVIPAFDKNSIPTLAALFGCMFVTSRPVRFGNSVGLTELLMATFIFSPFVTSILNGDTIVAGDTIIPGIGAYDGASVILVQLFVLGPFLIGRQFLRSGADTENIMRILAIAGLVYSAPMLFEIRMSPQLHTWIYGYFPQSFDQTIRDGGFRPVVFLGHGLLIAFFAMTSVVASAALWRTQTPTFRLAPSGITAYLTAVLVLCKTGSALAYGLVLSPLVRWASPRTQIRMATVIVAFALSYPTLRAMDLVPTNTFVNAANTVSTDRAQSLETRFNREQTLLNRAFGRFWFGWGRFGRSFVSDESGAYQNAADGHWIITMGYYGFVGFLAEFGLLTLPVFLAASALRFVESSREAVFLAALSLIIAVDAFNQLPNASLSPWSWLLTGALLGRAEALRKSAIRFSQESLQLDPP